MPTTTSPEPPGLTRALTRTHPVSPVPQRSAIAPARLLPLAQRSLMVAGVALAAEYALRVAVGGALERIVAPIRGAAPVVTRTEITEWVVVERLRRR